jgi:hypothetical protein
VLASAASLLVGIATEGAAALAAGLVAAAGALVLLAVQVVRSSGPPQRHRHG